MRESGEDVRENVSVTFILLKANPLFFGLDKVSIICGRTHNIFFLLLAKGERIHVANLITYTFKNVNILLGKKNGKRKRLLIIVSR